MTRLAVIAGALLAVAAAAAADDDGFRLVDATAASVNGEVIFLSDVDREACLYRCGAFPGDEPVPMTRVQARDKLVADTLVLQEQAKLGLGGPDNAALAEAAAGSTARLAACADPCARSIGPEAVREFSARRLVVRDFLAKRISVFVEVSDEDVAAEVARRKARGDASGDLSPDAVRRDLYREKAAREVRNWKERAASKSRIILSPLEER
ncbi:MAG: hypothetical protein ACM3NF_02650 [Gemmatimonadota bacterium]